MQFKLFDSLAGGNQIGTTINDVPVTASEGVFSAKLDFGSSVLNGANRWIEIAVRRNTGESYVTLSPREQIASSPYAVRTLSAATADNAQQLGGIPASEYVTTTNGGNSFIRNGTSQQAGNLNISGNGFFGGNIGIGTSSPTSRVEILGQDGLAITGFQPFLTLRDTNSGLRSLVSAGSGDLGFYPSSFIGGIPAVLIKNSTGNVGIGTGSPSQLVHVNSGSGNAATLVQTPANAFAQYQLKSGASNTWTIGTQENFANGGLLFRNGGSDFMNIHPNGSITQPRDKGGMIKAMLYVNGDGSIIRCYNGVTGSSTGNCGFTISRSTSGIYGIDFNFQITDRFISATVVNSNNGGVAPDAGLSIAGLQGSPEDAMAVYTYQIGAGPSDRPFMLIVY